MGPIPEGEAWWAAVYGVAQSRTRLKQLNSSSSSCLGAEALGLQGLANDEEGGKGMQAGAGAQKLRLEALSEPQRATSGGPACLAPWARGFRLPTSPGRS